MARINYLTTIEFGPGVVSTLPQALAELGVKKPLLVADKGIAASGLLAVATAMLPADTPVFLETPSNPTEAAVHAARCRSHHAPSSPAPALPVCLYFSA